MSNVKKQETKNEKNIIVNTKTVANIFGLTSRRINQMVEEGIIDRLGPGKFDLLDTVNKYITHLQTTSNAKNIDGSTSALKEKEDMMLKKAKRQKAELELQQLEGTLIYAEEAKRMYIGLVLNARSKFLGMPYILAPKLYKRSMEEISEELEKAIHGALTELSQSDVSTFEDYFEDYEKFIKNNKKGNEENEKHRAND